MGREMKPWVKKYLVPLGTSTGTLIVANKFECPQDYWQDCQEPDEMIWFLVKTGIEDQKLFPCLLGILDRVVPIYEEGFPEDFRIREAVNRIRVWSLDSTEENLEAVRPASLSAHNCIRRAAFAQDEAGRHSFSGERSAANAVAYATEVVLGDRNKADTASCAVSNSWYAAKNRDEEIKWQASYIKECFPEHPFEK